VKRVLVTGVTGFVGSAIARAVDRREFEIHGTTRPATAIGRRPNANVVMHETDLLDPAAAAALVSAIRPTHLLMSAWTTNHGEYWTDFRNDQWVASTDALARVFFRRRKACGPGRDLR
jgi:nucleoside-diphosphate-sugar epimerase